MTTGDEEFYRKHADSLLRLSYALAGPSDAEDIFSTAVLNVLRSNRWPELDEDAKRAYLYRSVVHQARRWGRRTTKRRQLEAMYALREAIEAPTVHAPDDSWEVVASLSMRQRAVIFLTYWDDLDTRTVAELLGISEGSVYKHLNRARTTLRRRIDV
jgi:RNA polymerase sigma factor (sigma-70 family)